MTRQCLKSVRGLACFLFLLARSPLSFAAPTGTVGGTVVDDKGPIPGAVVSMSGAPLLSPRGTMSDAHGEYHFADVPVGEYIISVTFAGGLPIRSAPFSVREKLLTKVPPISVFVEKVKVEGTSEKLVETHSTALGELFTSESLQSLPTGRSYTDVVQLAGGVSTNDGTGGVAAYGSTGLESSYYVDGINTTSIGSGKPGTQLHFDIIKNIQVKSGGYEAEYGGAQGAVINVETKTGGNAFTGSLAYYLAPDSLTAEPKETGFGTQLPTPDTQEIAGSLGGYFIKDKLFFYTGYSRANNSHTAAQRFGDIFSRQEAEDTEDERRYFFKTTWQVLTNHRLVASIFADPSEVNLRDELGGEGGDHQVKGGGTDGSLSYQAILNNGGLILSGELGFHNERNDVNPTEQQQEIYPIGDTRQNSPPSVRARCKDISDPYCLGSSEGLTASSTFGEPSLRFGPYPYSGDMEARRAYRKVTFESLLPKNDVKGGLEFDSADYHQTLDYGWGTGMSLEWLPVTSPLGDPFHAPTSILGVRRCWGDGQGNCRPWGEQIAADGATRSSQLFLQDTFTPAGPVTLNLGLRWERQNILDGEGNLLGSAAGELAPRFGATWDVVGEGRSKLYGSWGRYYDSIPMQVVSRAFSPRITSTRLYRAENWSQTGFLNDIRHTGICPSNDPVYDAGSAFHKTCWDFESADLVTDPNKNAFDLTDKVHSSLGVATGGYSDLYPDTIVDSGSLFRAPVDTQLKGAYTDEAVVGYDWEFLQGWKGGVKLIKRDLGSAIEDMSLDLGTNFIIGNPGGPYRFYVDPANTDMINPAYVPGSSDPAQQPGFAQMAGCAPGSVCEVDNADLERLGFGGFPKATRRFRGQQLDFSGRIKDKVWLNFTYLHSTTEGNYRGRYFVETEERDPNLTEAFDVPALVVNTDGPLPQDQRHQVKLYGNFQVSPNFTAGGTFRFNTGSPFSATTDPTGGSTPFLGPLFLLRRGTAGRLPSSKTVDLSMTYHLKDTGKLQMSLSLDIFNALNSQQPVAVDQQFLATGLWSGPFPDGAGGVIFSPPDGSRIGRGEPLLEYVDTAFGNGDGALDRHEWNAWASSFQGRFANLDQLYAFLRSETVTLNKYGETFQAPAYPGFAQCPAHLEDALAAGCAGINPGFGQALQLEAPRSVRFGFRLDF